jgi:hypothetical protein
MQGNTAWSGIPKLPSAPTPMNFDRMSLSLLSASGLEKTPRSTMPSTKHRRRRAVTKTQLGSQ